MNALLNSHYIGKYLQGPRKDGCHGCLAPVTLCVMGATGARFLLIFLDLPFQLKCFVKIASSNSKIEENIDGNLYKSMHLFRIYSKLQIATNVISHCTI